MTFTTIYEVVKHSVEKFSERIAFSMIGGEDVSYKEVGERVEKVQDMLLDAGVGAGDKVAILSSSMPNWGVSYFAVTSAGMIAVPILPDFTSEELDLIIAHSEAKAILVSDKLYTKLSKETVERFNIVIRTKGLNVISQRVTERAEKRITQQELAEKCGVSRQTINAIEAGKFIPSTVLALKMARTFGKQVEEIFELEEED